MRVPIKIFFSFNLHFIEEELTLEEKWLYLDSIDLLYLSCGLIPNLLNSLKEWETKKPK